MRILSNLLNGKYDSLNAQVKSKPAPELKAIFYVSSLETSVK